MSNVKHMLSYLFDHIIF